LRQVELSLCLKSFVFGSALGAHMRKSDNQHTHTQAQRHNQIQNTHIAET